MTLTANPANALLLPGNAGAQWPNAIAQLHSVMRIRQAHISRVVVLVPFAQLMAEAKGAWASFCMQQLQPSAFVPRFETTSNWAGAVRGFAYGPEDLQLDVAHDALTAASLLARAGLSAQQHTLQGRLLEAAWSLAKVAAAQPPKQRLAWGAQMALQIDGGMASTALELELALARIALAWAAASSYPTDVLFNAEVDAELDLLVVLDGFQSEPLVEALKTHFSDRAVSITLNTLAQPGQLGLHAAQDLEDEAHRATACVLAHIAAGRAPVGLVAQDRLLTRRVGALLAGLGVPVRDETGWTLSTTRAAATLMTWLRAMPWDASTDAVLDALKNAPAFDAAAVSTFEAALRKTGLRHWRAVPAAQPEFAAIATQFEAFRSTLQRPRPLADWLADLRAALQAAGLLALMVVDAAGIKVVAALHLEQASELTARFNPRLSLADFTAWAMQALEAATFAPAHPPHAAVVILPLSQLLGRPLQAVVLPGCDEVRLAVSPEPPGQWTAAQRVLLGLPSRAQLAQALQAAWQHALRMPHLDVLWRVSEGGERLMPSGFIQALQLLQPQAPAFDARPQRQLPALPTPPPQPTGQALPISTLSASAYEDLRRCPYRFFALRLLKLQEADELESELGKRDFGNWLHALLHAFHEALKLAPTQDLQARAAMLNIAAEQTTQALGLTAEEFLPFASIWPRVRSGYLSWLAEHEASGAAYDQGEVWKNMPLGRLSLVGKIDRIDVLPDGSRLVIDYKTEPSTTTKARVKDGGEDTQLAFYAALLADDTLAASYVNLGETQATTTHAQDNIVELRDDLIGGILSDMAGIAEGAPLLALGEGKACDYCAARGLCRRDFFK